MAGWQVRRRWGDSDAHDARKDAPGSGVRTVEPLESRRLFSTGSIAGRLFHDTDFTGVLDSDDAGVFDNRIVYVDLNRNGAVDAGEPAARRRGRGQHSARRRSRWD
jgi:hypothetical protein